MARRSPPWAVWSLPVPGGQGPDIHHDNDDLGGAVSEHSTGPADDPFAAQRDLNAFTANRGLITDRLIEQLQAEYAPAVEEKPVQSVPVQPGDVVVSETTGRLWWVHGHPGLSLSVTDIRGRCLPVPEAIHVHGPLSVLCRMTDHTPGSPPAPR
jgi:hypothetical protein